jgi:hypothetical protein
MTSPDMSASVCAVSRRAAKDDDCGFVGGVTGGLAEIMRNEEAGVVS